MAVTIKGTTGVSWGLTADVGILVQTVGSKVSIEKNEVRNHEGEFVAIAFYNPTKTFSISGVMTGTTGGVATATVANVIASNNFNTLGGVSVGLILVDDVDIAKGNTEWNKITVNATQRPLITS
jgi:hypothetical protein